MLFIHVRKIITFSFHSFLLKITIYFTFSTVAIQCLETVYKINVEDSHLAVPVRLTEMFADSCHKVRTEIEHISVAT